MVFVPARQATYAGGINSFELILALPLSLKTVCYVTLSLTPSV